MNVKADENLASSTTRRVCWKSSSVFAREATMMSVEICASGIASRIFARMPRNLSERYERRMARKMRSDPDCSGKCS